MTIKTLGQYLSPTAVCVFIVGVKEIVSATVAALVITLHMMEKLYLTFKGRATCFLQTMYKYICYHHTNDHMDLA